jgi:hypothetical protein
MPEIPNKRNSQPSPQPSAATSPSPPHFTYAANRDLLMVEIIRLGHHRLIAPTQLQLSIEEKLNLLNRLDRWRVWKSLDDRRLCLGCGRLFNGHEVEMVTGEDPSTVELHCPTRSCQSIPLDWILPNPRPGELQN